MARSSERFGEVQQSRGWTPAMIGFTALSTHVGSYHTEIKIQRARIRNFEDSLWYLLSSREYNVHVHVHMYVPGTPASLHKLQTKSIVSSGMFPSRQTNGLLHKWSVNPFTYIVYMYIRVSCNQGIMWHHMTSWWHHVPCSWPLTHSTLTLWWTSISPMAVYSSPLWSSTAQ